MIKNIFNDKKGRIQKLMLILLIICILLIPLGIYASENTTSADDNSASEQPLEEIVDAIVVEDQPVEKEVANEPLVEGIENLTEEPNPEENLLTNETEAIKNLTGDSNPEKNITTNKTGVIFVENQTEISDEETKIIFPTQTIASKLDIQIYSPQKITRREIIEINATLTNSGNAEINNILVRWEIPLEFEIIAGEITEILDNLFPGESHTIQISVQTSNSTLLGINEIKLNVNY